MEALQGVAVGVITLVVVLGALVAIGFVVLFRRRGDAGIVDTSPDGMPQLTRKAGSLLVKLDDELRDADNELGYAIAQFGTARTKPYGDAVADARGKVAQAFRLKQQLDDAYPDSDQDRRSWTLQIISLCTAAESALAAQATAFGQLRSSEANAGATLTDLRARIAASTARVATTQATLAGLSSKYIPPTFSQVSGNPAEATNLLAAASAAADTAEKGITSTGVSDVSDTLEEATRSALKADQLLDAVDRTAADLQKASDALETLRTKTTADLVEAKAERDKAPDADTGKAIIDAIAPIESILQSRVTGPSDPVAELDKLGDAVSALDQALASARNQAQRLEHAKAAYEGTLVSVKSQISSAQDYIGRFGGGVDARTRLAEAQRQLTIAEAEVDPVEALDAVRRSVTLARDADALARYSNLG